jgi:mannitol/fructose-specific phosphotransferase system IIA component (Ntr-type)
MAVMHLASLLSADQILADMKATERWPAIIELVDHLVGRGQLAAIDRDSVLGALRDREDSMSTGIGFGVAIPHASSDRVDHVVAAFGRSMKGIGFDSLDNEPVKFIVLFIVPQDQFTLHLRTLAAIAKFLNERGVRDRLTEAVGIEDILETLRGAAARV